MMARGLRMQHAIGRRYKDESHIGASPVPGRQTTPLTNFSALELAVIMTKITRRPTPLHTVQVSAREMIETLPLNFVGSTVG